MTDLLNAEDIKKAVGACAGELRSPLPSPGPLSAAFAPAPPRADGPGSVAGLSFSAPQMPAQSAGRWLPGLGGEGPQHFPKLWGGREPGHQSSTNLNAAGPGPSRGGTSVGIVC